MRRPHVYERSVPRARRDPYRVPDGAADEAARAVLRSMPGLIAQAETACLPTLVDRLEAARLEAERICASLETGSP